jgi:hypothetical protein
MRLLPRRRGWRYAVVAALALAVLVGSGGVWAAVRVGPVRHDLLAAGAELRELQQHLQDRDLEAARASLARLQGYAAAARADTAGWDWGVASAAPVVGDDLDAVRTVADVLDELSRQALPELIQLAGSMSLTSLVPASGQLDLAGLAASAAPVAAADDAVLGAYRRISAIKADHLVPQLRDGVGQFTDGLRRLAELTATARRVTTLVPPMLGADGPRTYLVLLQNLAEVRATGGMPGAYIVVRADHGAIRLIDQGTAATGLGVFATPVLPLRPEQTALYTERLGTFAADVNFTPHFPTVATLAREMYRRRSGRAVDGVLATDPVALSYVLSATAPLVVAGGPRLTAANAVRVLLSDVYASMSRPQQDAYYAAAARAVFEALSRGAVDPARVVQALARAAAERRLLVWSARPAEESALSGTVVEGALPVRDGGTPTVGVFLNDGSGAKLDYYLTHSAQLAVAACRPDTRLELRLRLTIGSTAPSTGLSRDVTGMALSGDPYTVRTNVMVFSPTGGSIVSMALDGQTVHIATGLERGRIVGVLVLDLRPGQRRTIEADLLTDALPGADVTPQLWVTPGVNPWQLEDKSTQTCANAH